MHGRPQSGENRIGADSRTREAATSTEQEISRNKATGETAPVDARGDEPITLSEATEELARLADDGEALSDIIHATKPLQEALREASRSGPPPATLELVPYLVPLMQYKHDAQLIVPAQALNAWVWSRTLRRIPARAN